MKSVVTFSRVTSLGVVLWLFPLFTFISFASSAVTVNPKVTISYLKPDSSDYSVVPETLDYINEELKTKRFPPYGGNPESEERSEVEFFKYVFKESDNPDSDGFTLTITMDLINYSRFTVEERRLSMETTLSIIQNSKISVSNRTKLYNFIADTDTVTSSLVRQLSSDVKADYATAYSWFKPFTSPIGTILGLFAILIFVLFGGTILVDLAAINLPFFFLLLSKTSSEERPALISREAWKAIKLSEDIGKRRSANGTYLGMKLKEMALLAIAFLYLISGQLFNLMATVIDMFVSLIS